MSFNPVDTDQDSLAVSFQNFTTYPQNLVTSREFPHSHTSYADRLNEDAPLVFQASASSSSVRFLDLDSDGHGVLTPQQQSVTDLDGLRKLFITGKPDPSYRFIYLRSKTSRSCLACSLDEMKLILTAQQVMAPFVDLILTFRIRQTPHRLASFKSENHLDLMYRQPGLAPIGRSGIRIQHCFNILGMEKDRSHVWQPRQIAAYHSFDAVNGRAAWIVLKGDNIIRDRLQTSTLDTLKKRRATPLSKRQSFEQTLRDHLLILQWCAEGWAEYLDMKEVQCEEITVMTRSLRVHDMAKDAAKWEEEDRLAELAQRQPTNDEDPASKPAGMLQKVASTLTELSRVPTGVVASPPRRQLSFKQKMLRLDDQASFADMQKLRQLAVEIQQAMSCLEQSARVVEDVRKSYHDLVRSEKFKQHLTEEEIKTCRDHADDLETQLSIVISSLDSFRARARIIHDCTEHGGDVFNHIFQERSVFTAEYFAASSRDSADAMELMTKRMHQKTMSMHVVTLVTLIFLPGTFVATVFSSGILTFGEEGDIGFGKNMGDWKLRLAGLKLFFAICVPLLCVTICVWLAAYRSARLRKEQDEENDVSLDIAAAKQDADHDVSVTEKPSDETGPGEQTGVGSVARKAVMYVRNMAQGASLKELHRTDGMVFSPL